MPSNPDLSEESPLEALQSWPIALLLTLVGGYIDMVGYLSAYRVFTAHMSGNTADMARHIYWLDWSGIARHAWPILMFVLGLISGAIAFEAQRRKAIHQRFPATVVLESLLILIFLITSLLSGFPIPPQPTPRYYFMVGLLAVAMGVQNVTLRRVGGLNVYTTFITGTLVRFGEAASQYIFWFVAQYQRAGRSSLILILRATPGVTAARHMALTATLWVGYLSGATAGASALTELQTRCVMLPLVVLIAIAIYGGVRPFSTIAEEW